MLGSIKQMVRPMLRPFAPTIGRTARSGELLATFARGVRVDWFSEWNPVLDDALNLLPPPPGCTLDQYRELLQPTSAHKQHALITQQGDLLAIISLRRRAATWEPVSLQTISGYIAPAASEDGLRLALRSLGREVQVPFGLSADVLKLMPRTSWTYDYVEIDLRSDYQSHWLRNGRKHHKHVRSAETKCAGMDLRFDDKDDLEWIVNQWRIQWAHDEEQEICAADDRIRFWKSLGAPSRDSGKLGVQVVQLLDGDKRVAGVIDTYRGDDVQGQCMARLDEYRRAGPGTRALAASMERGAERGFKTLNMGGGDYKNLWGPLAGKRYGAIFRPASVEWLHRLN